MYKIYNSKNDKKSMALKNIDRTVSNNKYSSLFKAGSPEFRTIPVSVSHNFYLYGELTEVENYVELIDTLDNASESDQINIFLNTVGGNLMAAVSIMHAMNRSNANVVAIADGEVASAGTLIFFSAPTKIIMPYSYVMLHDVSTTIGGKLSDSIKGISAISKLISDIAHDVYFPYFTTSEIEEILEGKDFYCDSEELHQRLLAAEELIEEELSKQEEMKEE